jgi:hypothetical protein
VIYCQLRWEYVISITLAAFVAIMLIVFGIYKGIKYGHFRKPRSEQAPLVNEPVVVVDNQSSGRRLSMKLHEVNIGNIGMPVP